MKKQYSRLPWARIGFSLLAFACWGGSLGCGSSFATTYDAWTKGKTGQALYDELLRLDQAYPNRLRLKIDLGERLLSAGDLEGAKTYLDRGDRLVGPFVDSHLKYILYADQAKLNLRMGAFQGALAYSTKAIACSSDDELGVIFTRAKTESAFDDKSAALKDFDRGWGARKASMSAEDYRAYALALKGAGRDADAICLLGDYQKAFPYDPGLGILESGCYEKLGDIRAAILSAFKDYEYRRSFGGLSDKALAEGMDAAIEKADPHHPRRRRRWSGSSRR